jgi:hypothetical protein
MTEPKHNRRIVLAERPRGRATLSSFRFGKLVVNVGGADT